jgi:hypothetical protein
VSDPPPRQPSEPEPEAAPERELNLLSEEPRASVNPSPLVPASHLVGRKKRLEDWARVGIAAILVALLFLLVLSTGVVVMFYPEREPAIESFLKLVFAPVIGLVGSVIGFYFGSRRSESPP